MNQFDYDLYFKLYPDLKTNNINTPGKMMSHWTYFGKKEKRVNNVASFIQKYKFDYSFYVTYYDLKHIKNIREAILDWNSIGKKLGRVVNKNSLPSEKKKSNC